MSEENEILFNLPEEQDELPEVVPQYRSAASDSDLVSIRRTEEEVRALREEQERAKIERTEREQRARIAEFEAQYEDVDPRQKSYIKAFLKLQTDLVEKKLAEERKNVEDLKNKLASTEIKLEKVANHAAALDYREALNDIAHIALSEKTTAKFPDGKIKSQYIDFALSEYELRRANDPGFNQQVLSITNDPKLTNTQIKSKLATLIARNTEKALVEKHAKGGVKALKEAEVNVPSKQEAKKQEQKTKQQSQAEENTQPELSEEAQRKLLEQYASRLRGR